MVRRSPKSDTVPPLEWGAAALGLLVLLMLLAILGYDLATGGATQDVPHLTARIEAVTATPGGQVAEVMISNGSSQTAAAVQIEGKLGDEVATATIDYVPGHSEARAGLLFAADPRAGAAQLRVVGYELP